MQLIHSIRNPYLFLLLAPLFWAGNVVLARGVTDVIPPVAFAFWRWTIAALLVLPFTWRRVRREWTAVRRHWPILLLLAVLGISCFNTLLYLGVQTTTAINGAVIQTAMPAMIVIISLLLFQEPITLRQAVAVAISISGALLIVFRGQFTTLLSMTFVTGDVLIFIAVALYALYSALLRKRPLTHPLTFLTVTFVAGATGLFPFYLWELSTGAAFTLNRTVILSVLYVAIFPSIMAYICWNQGIARIGANRAGLFINFVPLFAAVLSMLFLDEPPRLYHLAGMVLILGGMLLFNYTSPAPQPTQAPAPHD